MADSSSREKKAHGHISYLEEKMSKMKKIALVLIIACLCSTTGNSENKGLIAIKNGKLITITRGILEGGTILIKEGKIAAIGKNVSIPASARVIDASKFTVMPGLIDAFTNLGASDIMSQNNDYEEGTSPVTPHMRIIDSIYPENRFISLARKTGITTVLCAPGEGNLISGQSALIHLSGHNVDDMIIIAPAAVHGNMGEIPKLKYGAKRQYPSTRMGEAALLRQTLLNSRDYMKKKFDYKKKFEEFEKKRKKGKSDSSKKPSPPPSDFKLEALIPVLKRELPFVVRANRIDDILTTLRITEEFNIKLILNHAADGFRVASKLAEKDISVLVGPVSSYYQREETSRASMENAAILHRAGVKIAFQTGSFKNYGDLLSQARKSVSYGLPAQEALKAMTIYPAEIFGVADQIGSLEKGKAADLILFDGDPLQAVSKVVMVIIGGTVIEDLRKE